MGNVVRWWQSWLTAGDRPDDKAAADALLVRRMSILGVDADTFARVEPALFGDLRALCRECERPNLCRRDLRHDPAGVAWEDYCPKAVVLNAVTELRWSAPHRRTSHNSR
jgi:hypothetical protein